MKATPMQKTSVNIESELQGNKENHPQIKKRAWKPTLNHDTSMKIDAKIPAHVDLPITSETMMLYFDL